MKSIVSRVFLTLTFILFTQWSWAVSNEDALTLVKQTTQEVLKELQRGDIENNPARVYKLIDEVVLPNFDFKKMSMYVLGKNWRKATEDQQERFVKAFRNLLVRTYSKTLTEAANADVEVSYSPIRDPEGSRRITVRTKVTYNNQTVELDYDMYSSKDTWKVWNVKAGGVSLVTNYRSEFENDIQSEGIDSLINKLQTKNAKALKVE